MKRLTMAVMLGVLVTACSTDAKPVDPNKQMTQRQKDSVLGQSQVPGAPAVNKAMTAADSQSAKASQFNALQDSIH
jgi:hypothetical protein